MKWCNGQSGLDMYRTLSDMEYTLHCQNMRSLGNQLNNSMHNCKKEGCHHPDNVSQSNCTGCIKPNGKIDDGFDDLRKTLKTAIAQLNALTDHLNSQCEYLNCIHEKTPSHNCNEANCHPGTEEESQEEMVEVWIRKPDEIVVTTQDNLGTYPKEKLLQALKSLT